MTDIRRGLLISLLCTFPLDSLIGPTLAEIEELARKVVKEIRHDAPYCSLSPTDNKVVVPSHLLSEVMGTLSCIELVEATPAVNTTNIVSPTASAATTACSSGNSPSTPRSDRISNQVTSSSQTGGTTKNAATEPSIRVLRPRGHHDFRETRSTVPQKRKRGAQKFSQFKKRISNPVGNPKSTIVAGAACSSSSASGDDEETDTATEPDDILEDEQENPDDGDTETEGLGNEGLLEPDLSEDDGLDKNARVARAQSVSTVDEESEPRHEHDLSSVCTGTKKLISTASARIYMLAEIRSFAAQINEKSANRNRLGIGVPVINGEEVATPNSMMAQWEYYLSLEVSRTDIKIITMLVAVQLAKMVDQLMR